MGVGVSFESFGKYHDKLSDGVRKGLFKKLLEDKYTQYVNYVASIENEKKSFIGTAVPAFVLKDISGEEFYYQNNRNKYIVLDFWGTWCGPCVKELPILKSYYGINSSKFILIGIACKDNVDELKKLVGKENLNWTQLIDSDKESLAVKFGITAYPTKLIIDKNNVIIAKIVGSIDEFYKKMGV